MNILILIVAFAGFGALCLSMERHAKQALGAIPSLVYRRIASVLGWSLLVVAMVLSIREYGVSIGIAAWLGFLTMAGCSVGLLLTYAPRRVRSLASIALALGGVGALLF